MKKTYIGYHLDDDNEECQGTQGQVMSDVHANCFTCNQAVPIDETPVFYPIDDIIHLEDMTTEEQETTPALVDWSTCFEVDNISVSIEPNVRETEWAY